MINTKVIQITIFNYLQCMISYEEQKYIEAKIDNFLKVTGLVNTIFKPSKVQKHTTIKIYNTYLCIYRSENQTMKIKLKTRITDTETQFMRRTVKYTWVGHKIK